MRKFNFEGAKLQLSGSESCTFADPFVNISGIQGKFWALFGCFQTLETPMKTEFFRRIAYLFLGGLIVRRDRKKGRKGVNFFKKTARSLLPFRNLRCFFSVKNAHCVTHFRRILSVTVIDSQCFLKGKQRRKGHESVPVSKYLVCAVRRLQEFCQEKGSGMLFLECCLSFPI